MTHPAVRRARLLVGGYLALSVATLTVVAVLTPGHATVSGAVWVRSVIVAATALLMFVLAHRAVRGSRGAWRRWRVMAAVMIVAIVVIIAIPGAFPVWLRVEQGVCGLLLIAVLALISRRPVRTTFDAR
ncbi:hypothetical protein [Amycolatopsis viridis]|uniref:O-antigen/teichoic acid export membrane protein n=1 Tax=Amycolatopsis viridis TaxID=185678 RepID=A0ABX0SWB2_9PSEU|nr:hypothetical protein [Amycolatopsis viridis]NIH81256.1 O-antigen/teichoic acid export membrane protein [Amycolatopsis viridis]